MVDIIYQLSEIEFSAVFFTVVVQFFFAVFKHHLPVDPHMEMGCQEQEVKLKYSAIALEKIVMLHPVVHLQLMILTGEYYLRIKSRNLI